MFQQFLRNTFCITTFFRKCFIRLVCLIFQLFVLSGVIAMVTCAVFLRLNSLLKLLLLLLAVAVYSYLIHVAFLTLTHHDTLHRSACSPLGMTRKTLGPVANQYPFLTPSQVSVRQEKRDLHASHGHGHFIHLLQWPAGTLPINACCCCCFGADEGR